MENEPLKNGVYAPYFYHYIRLVEDADLFTILENQLPQMQQLMASIDEEKSLYSYASDKWNIREVLQHITDAERVFAFRAFVFSRRDPNTFPSFDDKIYARNSFATQRDWKAIIDEFASVRTATLHLFRSFTAEQMDAVGTAGDFRMSVKALGFTIAGHLVHHVNLLHERYQVPETSSQS